MKTNTSFRSGIFEIIKGLPDIIGCALVFCGCIFVLGFLFNKVKEKYIVGDQRDHLFWHPTDFERRPKFGKFINRNPSVCRINTDGKTYFRLSDNYVTTFAFSDNGTIVGARTTDRKGLIVGEARVLPGSNNDNIIIEELFFHNDESIGNNGQLMAQRKSEINAHNGVRDKTISQSGLFAPSYDYYDTWPIQ